MNFLKNIFANKAKRHETAQNSLRNESGIHSSKKEETIKTYSDFWAWFQVHEQSFFKVVQNNGNIEEDFFAHLSVKLGELKDGYYYLTGMFDDTLAELILTADADVKNIVFIEELMEAAPAIPNWKFTALKPALDIENVRIEMAGYRFDSENLSFYAKDHKYHPDEVDIVIVHNDYKEKDKSILINGTYIFLDNFLGELNSATTIDKLTVIPKKQAEKELIPIAKIKDYLIWREKEFVEKYNERRYNTENDGYASMEGELKNGDPWIAVVNTTLLDWDNKTSHPWILEVKINYEDSDNGGMPDDSTYELLDVIEGEIMTKLRDVDGYLNVGRQTAENTREIYFACKDFRRPSKVLHDLVKKHPGNLEMSYDIHKDKYWHTFEKFRRG